MSDHPGDKTFREHVGKVRRLRYDGVEPERKRTPPRLRPQDPAPATDMLMPAERSLIGSDFHDAAVGGDYHRPGLQRAVLKKLRRGQFGVQDELDLHGLRLEEVGARLAAFLELARGRRLCCVRIIHGKGLSSPGRQPVLKPQVARWLRAHDAVLAFSAVRDADGGSGALYVLLRARRETREDY